MIDRKSLIWVLTTDEPNLKIYKVEIGLKVLCVSKFMFSDSDKSFWSITIEHAYDLSYPSLKKSYNACNVPYITWDNNGLLYCNKCSLIEAKNKAILLWNYYFKRMSTLGYIS